MRVNGGDVWKCNHSRSAGWEGNQVTSGYMTDLVVERDALRKNNAKLVNEVTELRSKLADGDEYYRRVINEECAPDEQHCTCVPALRHEIDLTFPVKVGKIAREALEHAKVVLQHAEYILAEYHDYVISTNCHRYYYRYYRSPRQNGWRRMMSQTAGDGWTCPDCGRYVWWNQPHKCLKAQPTYYTGQWSYPYPIDPIKVDRMTLSYWRKYWKSSEASNGHKGVETNCDTRYIRRQVCSIRMDLDRNRKE